MYKYFIPGRLASSLFLFFCSLSILSQYSLIRRREKDQKKTSFARVYTSKMLSQQTQTSLRRLQDVLKRSRCLTTKPDVIMTSYRRRLIYDVLKTPDLRRLEDVCKTTSLQQRRSNVCITSKKMIFSYHIQKILKGSIQVSNQV